MDLSTRTSSEIDVALRERVKELTCLYEIARISANPGASLGDVLQAIVDVLPAAWQHPELASARIALEETSYVSPTFTETETRLVTELGLHGQSSGAVEVFYADSPVAGSPTFLEQEQKLLNTVARQLELIVEQWRVHGRAPGVPSTAASALLSKSSRPRPPSYTISAPKLEDSCASRRTTSSAASPSRIFVW